jgi:hypothetical protein
MSRIYVLFILFLRAVTALNYVSHQTPRALTLIVGSHAWKLDRVQGRCSSPRLPSGVRFEISRLTFKMID